MENLKPKLDVESVRDTIMRYNLAGAVDCLQHGYTMKFVGSGLFRNVYRIVGTKLVVKVPIGIRGKRHSEGEMKAYRKIMGSKHKYTAIQLYMPEILAYNKKTGVILMPEYRKVAGCDRAKVDEIGTLARAAMGKYCDLHKNNVGKGKLGDYRVLDLGYFVGRVKPKPKRKVA